MFFILLLTFYKSPFFKTVILCKKLCIFRVYCQFTLLDYYAIIHGVVKKHERKQTTMKKLKALALVSIVFVILILAFVSCDGNDHTHTFSDATCTAPKTCECGATEGEALGHTVVTDAAE